MILTTEMSNEHKRVRLVSYNGRRYIEHTDYIPVESEAGQYNPFAAEDYIEAMDSMYDSENEFITDGEFATEKEIRSMDRDKFEYELSQVLFRINSQLEDLDPNAK